METATVEVAAEGTWMSPIYDYIANGILPEGKEVARKLKYKATRYGVPYKLIYDNGKQFDGKKMKQLCEELHIKKGFSAVCHPQSNGQTEAINKITKHTLKEKFEESKGCWPEELHRVLWFYNTTPRTITGESPFTLTYGCEAMVTVEIGAGSFRRENYDLNNNEINHRLYLDLLEEVRENSQLKLAAYQQRTMKYFDKKVRARPLRVGDLVLRRMMPNMRTPGHGVFGANGKVPTPSRQFCGKERTT
ncbi:uncharacterized protein LOC141664709 [Apium graveolens]|uniref:uncharacterized protein LOC141664709 n=1 Tax=Apium graveolens TaxID=4045 RepID=UPI003D7A57CE